MRRPEPPRCRTATAAGRRVELEADAAGLPEDHVPQSPALAPGTEGVAPTPRERLRGVREDRQHGLRRCHAVEAAPRHRLERFRQGSRFAAPTRGWGAGFSSRRGVSRERQTTSADGLLLRMEGPPLRGHLRVPKEVCREAPRRRRQRVRAVHVQRVPPGPGAKFLERC